MRSHTLDVLVVAVVFGLASQGLRAAADTTPTALLEAACPEAWKALDTTITPGNVVPWNGNSADRGAFVDFLHHYLFSFTTGTNDREANADDALTVASECTIRKDRVVDNYFNKTIDTSAPLTSVSAALLPIIQMLLRDESDE